MSRAKLRGRIVMWYSLFVTSLLFCMCSSVMAQEESSADATLSVQEALDIALTHHPTLRIGQTTVEAAQQRVYQQTAGYLPRGAYTYEYSRQERPLTAAVGGVRVGEGPQQRTFSQTFNSHSTNVSISQVLFDFGRTLDLIRSALASKEASAADLETTRQQ